MANTIWLFVGSVIGALNVLFLFPYVLQDEQIGLARLLTTIAILISQVASVGGPTAVLKFIPIYRKSENNFSGLLTVIFSTCFIGFLITSFLLFLGKDFIVGYYKDNSALLVEFFLFLLPLIFAQIFTQLITAFSESVLKSVFPLFLNEVLLRGLQSILLCLIYFQIIDFKEFMYLFVCIHLLIGLLIYCYMLINKHLKFHFRLDISFNNYRQILKYGFANMLSGLAGGITNRIDLVMIGSMVGSMVIIGNDDLSNSGLYAITVYSIAAYMATMIEMPARALSKIATSFISNAWKENDLSTISLLYKKSAVNQLLFGLLVFGIIWINIDGLLIFSGKDYSAGKWVFLFLGLAKLIHVGSGLNGKIIYMSNYYWVFTILTIGLAILTFITNFFFISYFENIQGWNGIDGAAIATAISILIFNLVAVLFLKFKFNLFPYSLRIVFLLFSFCVALYMSTIFQIDNFFIDVLLKSSLFSLLYLPLIFMFNISDDFNGVVNKLFNK
jgi:O-antigen/teichoic acid export membrane protein